MKKIINRILEMCNDKLNCSNIFKVYNGGEDTRFEIYLDKKIFPESRLELYINFGPEYVLIDFVDMESHLHKNIYKVNINSYNINDIEQNLDNIIPIYRQYINFYKEKIKLNNIYNEYTNLIKQYMK